MVLPLSSILILANMRLATLLIASLVLSAALDAGEKESVRPVLEAGRNFWSFSPLEQPKVPQVEDTKWCRTDVDRFVRKRQETKGLVPSSTADARTLLRRAYFDLTGLLPCRTDGFLPQDRSRQS